MLECAAANAAESAAVGELRNSKSSQTNQPLKRQLGLDETTTSTTTTTLTDDDSTHTNDTLNHADDDADDACDATTSTTTTTTAAAKLLRAKPANLGALRRNSARRSSKMSTGRPAQSKFRRLAEHELSSTPAPDVKIGQRVAYKEYYGSEFGTIRWIGRVPQISADWTVGVEFDNAIGEGDGSLNGRRYFTAKDCFAKFLPLDSVACVEQHVGRPEPGTMISVMSAAVRPGQMISIQRVSTVHVEHCFLNAPHQVLGADLLAVNSRLHCQCPNCGPCAHVVKPPRTQRLARGTKNATHMCQFSTYTCCGMCNQEDLLCSYTGNKANDWHEPQQQHQQASESLPQLGNSWFLGAGYLSQLRAQQTTRLPDDVKRKLSFDAARRSSYKQQQQKQQQPPDESQQQQQQPIESDEAAPCKCQDCQLSDCWQESAANSLSDRPQSAAGSIDSRLESDLERLSLARYGRPSKRSLRRNAPRRSLSSSNEPVSQRRLFKSLLSLVACFQPSNRQQQQTNNFYNYQQQQSQCQDYGSSSLGFVDHGRHDQQSNSFSCSSSPIPTDTDGHAPTSVDPNNICVTTEDSNLEANQLASGPSQQLQQLDSCPSDCGFGSASQIGSSQLIQQSQHRSRPVKSAPVDAISDRQVLAELVYARIAHRLLTSDANKDDADQLRLELDKLRSLLLGTDLPISPEALILDSNFSSQADQTTVVSG